MGMKDPLDLRAAGAAVGAGGAGRADRVEVERAAVDRDLDAGAAHAVAGADDRARVPALRGPTRQEAGALGGRERGSRREQVASNGVRSKAASSRSGPTNRAAASRSSSIITVRWRPRSASAKARRCAPPGSQLPRRACNLSGSRGEAKRQAVPPRTERRAWGRRSRQVRKGVARQDEAVRAHRRQGDRGRGRLGVGLAGDRVHEVVHEGADPGEAGGGVVPVDRREEAAAPTSGREPHLQDRAAPLVRTAAWSPSLQAQRAASAGMDLHEGLGRVAGEARATGRCGSWCASGRARGRC